jgi:hypothetical protein
MSGGIAGRTGEGNRRVDGRSASAFNIRVVDFSGPASAPARSPEFLYSPALTRLTGLEANAGSTNAFIPEAEGTELAGDATEDQGERTMAATLEDRGAPPPGGIAIAPGEPAPAGAACPESKSRLWAAAKRHGALVALIAVTIFYVFRPRDLAPDGKWYGGMDDLVFLVLLAFLARRAAKSTPALFDLPNIISRAVRRTLRLDR